MVLGGLQGGRLAPAPPRHASPHRRASCRPRRPITVYECDGCGARAVGQQRCEDCGTFMRKLGLGGPCPHCDEPVAVVELLDQEVVLKD